MHRESHVLASFQKDGSGSGRVSAINTRNDDQLRAHIQTCSFHSRALCNFPPRDVLTCARLRLFSVCACLGFLEQGPEARQRFICSHSHLSLACVSSLPFARAQATSMTWALWRVLASFLYAMALLRHHDAFIDVCTLKGFWIHQCSCGLLRATCLLYNITWSDDTLGSARFCVGLGLHLCLQPKLPGEAAASDSGEWLALARAGYARSGRAWASGIAVAPHRCEACIVAAWTCIVAAWRGRGGEADLHAARGHARRWSRSGD